MKNHCEDCGNEADKLYDMELQTIYDLKIIELCKTKHLGRICSRCVKINVELYTDDRHDVIFKLAYQKV